MKRQAQGEPLEFSHNLQTQIGGQSDAGIVLTGFYEDHRDSAETPLIDFMLASMATLAIKP